jgi:hypothetical protein
MSFRLVRLLAHQSMGVQEAHRAVLHLERVERGGLHRKVVGVKAELALDKGLLVLGGYLHLI